MGGGSSKSKAEGGAKNDPLSKYGKITTLAGGEFGVTEKELGRGAYSTVRVGIRVDQPQDDREVAVKCIDTLSLKLRDRKALEDEIRILRDLNHPHIVRMFADIKGDEGMYYIVMELVEGGELFDRIVELEAYTEVQARATSVVILDALRHLHSKNICHRDLKPENLLLKSADTDHDVKIADFGFAAETTKDKLLTDMCGTPGYVAPEVIKMGWGKDKGKGYSLECDMWSVGVIIFVLLGGYPPFDDDDQKVLFQLIAAGKYKFHEEFWSDISDAAKDLISKLLVVDPAKRMTAEEALKHPWLELSEQELQNRHLGKNQVAMKKWNQRRKLRKVYMAVVAANRMRNLIDGITKGAKLAAEEEEEEAATGGGGGGEEAAGDVPGMDDEALAQAFTAFDNDGDGTIDAAELGTVMGLLGQKPDAEELDKLIKELDVDGSGSVDFNEFKLMMARKLSGT